VRLLHHVQVSCPPGGEDAARAFWTGALGLTEIAKPEPLRGRGGCWFRWESDGRVLAEIHVGVEQDFRPARKAHPALVVDDLGVVVARLRAASYVVDERERDTFPGYLRVHVTDPFGNRVEVLEAVVDVAENSQGI
jgi:catechol 2,3-dioxygenase-like lactoylglutathione lyase family enzyme